MGSRGRPPTAVILTESEREALQRWSWRQSTSQSLALRSKIVLACDKKRNPILTSAWSWVAARRRCRNGGCGSCNAGFADWLISPCSGAPRTITDDIVEAVVVDALETTPGEDTHWSTRGMAAKHGISRETVGRIWRAFGLTPMSWTSSRSHPTRSSLRRSRHRRLYLSPPLNAACFAVDEKPQIQALNCTAPILPMLPTTPQRGSHDYARNGPWTCSPRSNRHRPSHPWLRSTIPASISSRPKQGQPEVPAELEVHVVLD